MTQVSASLDAPSTPRPSERGDADRYGISDADRALLKIPIRKLKVPKVVRETKRDLSRTVQVYVVDPVGREVEWVTQVCNALLGTDGLAPKTCDTYAASFGRAAPVMWAIGADPQRLTPIQYSVVLAWLNECRRRTVAVPGDAARPMAHSTVDGTETALARIYEMAFRLGLIDSDPAAGLRVVPKRIWGDQRFDTAYGRLPHESRGRGRRRRRKAPQKQIKTVPEWMQEHLLTSPQLRDRALWTFCLETGPRISEALSITPATYFPSENYALGVAKGLGGARREIPLSDKTVEAIDAYLADLARRGFTPRAWDPIFRHVKRPYAPLEYGGAWAALRRRTKAKDIHPHALRHTAATEVLRLIDDPEGKGLEAVKIMLGHSNVATTSKYLHLTKDEVIATVVRARRQPRRRAEALDGIYAPEHMSLLEQILQEAAS